MSRPNTPNTATSKSQDSHGSGRSNNKKNLHSLDTHHDDSQNFYFKAQNSAGVKLARGSSARIGLSQRQHQIEEDLDKDSKKKKKKERNLAALGLDAQGGIRTEQDEAILVMQMIYEKAGKEPVILGISASDRLQSLRTEPALEVLKNQTWRNFFTGKHTSADQAITGVGADEINNGENNEKYVQQQKLLTNINKTFDKMIIRVENLWEILKISTADKEFYKQSICKGPPQSYDQCKEVAKYILALNSHRLDTMKVLKAIQEREHILKRCYDVLGAIHRKTNRDFSNQSQINHEGEIWRKELVLSLKELQLATLNVIKYIQLWRKNLWRPRSFLYREKNYLNKIIMDMNVLDSDIYSRQLSLCQLNFNDLLCIVFPSDEIRDRIGFHDISLENGHPLRQLFYQQDENILHDLIAANRIILGEKYLQAALKSENKTLKKKGVFIPLLKVATIPKDERSQTLLNTGYNANIAGTSVSDARNASPSSGKAEKPVSNNIESDIVNRYEVQHDDDEQVYVDDFNEYK